MYLGDYKAGDEINFKFTTRDAGVPFTLAGTPAVSVYKSNGTTESTSGVTLTADFDSRTGLNHVRITTASDGTFYANASDFAVVITTGTVNSYSVVGEVVAHFSLANRQPVGAAAASALNLLFVSSEAGTAQAGASTTITLRSGASSADDFYNLMAVVLTGGTGAGQVRKISDYTGSTRIATVDTAWGTTPDSTTTYQLIGRIV